MPWHVAKSDDCPSSRPWAVIKDDDGEVEGCHETEDEANEQMRALYASEEDDKAMTRKNRKSSETDPTTDPRFERKAVSVVGVKIVDEAQGIVEAVVSGIGNVDDGGDIVMPTFFESSLNTHLQKLPKGVWSHDWDLPVAKTLETYTLPVGDPRLPKGLKEAGAGGQYVKGQFNLRTQRGRDAFEDVKFFSASDEQEWSIGYVPIITEVDENGNRQLKEGAWYEWSPVLFGMNPLTATVGVKNLAAIAGLSYEKACKRLRELMDGDETKRVAVLDAIRDMAKDDSAPSDGAKSAVTVGALSPADSETKQFAGSWEERFSSVQDAIDSWVKDNSPGGEVEDEMWGGYMAFGWAVATFDDHVVVCVVDQTLDGDDRRKHYDFPLTLADGAATLGDPTEVKLEVVVSPKSIEACVELKRVRTELARKEGRRHNKADEDAVQRIHDDAVTLGAACPDGEDDEEFEETAKGGEQPEAADIAAEAAELASMREALGLPAEEAPEPVSEPTGAVAASQDEPETVDPDDLAELTSLASSLA